MADTDKVRSWPTPMNAATVRGVLDGMVTQLRRPVTWRNSTVFSHPAKLYWPNLLFEHAVPMEQSSLFVVMFGSDKAPRDVHLSVPFQHPEDPPEQDIEYLPRYRVRPKWRVGDWFVRGFSADRLTLRITDFGVERAESGNWEWIIFFERAETTR